MQSLRSGGKAAMAGTKAGTKSAVAFTRSTSSKLMGASSKSKYKDGASLSFEVRASRDGW